MDVFIVILITFLIIAILVGLPVLILRRVDKRGVWWRRFLGALLLLIVLFLLTPLIRSMSFGDHPSLRTWSAKIILLCSLSIFATMIQFGWYWLVSPAKMSGFPKADKRPKASVIFMRVLIFVIPFLILQFLSLCEEFARIENPEKTHVLIFYEDTWQRFIPAMPGQGSDVSGKIRLETIHGKCVRERKAALVRQIDLSKIYWETNHVFSIHFGHWTFDGKGSYDENSW